jgi:hypothetical protein
VGVDATDGTGVGAVVGATVAVLVLWWLGAGTPIEWNCL